MCLVAMWIKLDSPGPVIFKQKRVGKNKELFEIWKFRTMRIDAPSNVPTHLLENPEDYITRVGRFLRRTSLDELPQMLQCFIGTLSLIGPRPALWNQTDLIEERDLYGVHQLRPGITGWAQINGRDELAIHEKVLYDREYVRRFGLLMDIRCFLGTFYSVLSGKGVAEGTNGSPKKKALKEDEKETARCKEPFCEAASSSETKYLILTNHSYMLWQFRRELIQALSEHGKVTLVMPFVGHEDDFRSMGCRCIEVKMDRRGKNPERELKLARTCYQILKEEQPDQVLTYSIKPNIYGGYACSRLKIPYSVNVQGLGTAFQNKLSANFATFLYRRALKSAQAVFFENSENAEEFRRRKILENGQAVVLPGAGVNRKYFSWKEYPSEEGGIHILYLGRIMKEKGMDEFFEAAISIKKKYKDHVIFDLVGFFEDDYQERVEQLVKDHIIVFHGFQPDPRPYYEMAHCVVLPSYHEGMSNVLLEAASTGRCLITSDIPGCRETVRDGVSGYLVKVMDSCDLSAKLEQFLETGREKREAMGKAGREWMKAFDKDIVVERTLLGMQNI
jgi:lipopolysaccharide/colanic/teichoic acid biosynthesis glycosyltransferase/glycosyltransferase involved in cell wall biosynthesis